MIRNGRIGHPKRKYIFRWRGKERKRLKNEKEPKTEGKKKDNAHGRRKRGTSHVQEREKSQGGGRDWGVTKMREEKRSERKGQYGKPCHKKEKIRGWRKGEKWPRAIQQSWKREKIGNGMKFFKKGT